MKPIIFILALLGASPAARADVVIFGGVGGSIAVSAALGGFVTALGLGGAVGKPLSRDWIAVGFVSVP